MMPLEHDKLLPKCQILEKEPVMRAKEANQRSAAEFKETKHAAGYSRIVMQTKAAMLLIVIDSKVGRSFGEEQPKKLPVILSPEEVVRFLDCIAMRKHRPILTTCYGAGLRISEAVALTLPAIDSKRMVLRVEQGKGQKDRLRDAFTETMQDINFAPLFPLIAVESN